MAYSFTQIEKDKGRVIATAFCFLVFLYFIAFWIIALLVTNFYFFGKYFDESNAVFSEVTFQPLGWVTSFKIFLFALALAVVQWFFTTFQLVDRLIYLFRAQDPDPTDPTQKMFKNIVEEVCVATGGTHIRPMIIPSMMLNACALSDGKSIPVIAVTKGLLYKLNRDHIEAVVGHEAAHILSKDGEHTAIISSMFEIFGSSLQAMWTTVQGISDDSTHNVRIGYPRKSVSWGGGTNSRQGVYVVFFVIVIIIIIWVINILAALMRMFISRQREFRADAIAVRLTRNPLALAEALHIISHRRHSLYEGRDSLQSLMIVSPTTPRFFTETGLGAELFTTHPPIEERIRILLNMSFSSKELLDQALNNVTAKEEEELKQRQNILAKTHGGLWYVNTPTNTWVGPHNISAFTAFDWLTADTLVKKVGENTTMPISQIKDYMNEYRNLLKQHPTFSCPACGGKLSEITYESNQILQCDKCQGLLVQEDIVSVILERREKIFDNRIRQMAQALIIESKNLPQTHLSSLESERMYRCDLCQNNPRKMRRRIFNRYYPVEIEKCMNCGLVWFDKDELEVMQCMYEIRNLT